MIEYIKGNLAGLTPACAVVETPGGVAYLANISLTTFSALSGATEVKLLIHEVIREDQWVLFGFVDERERELFRLLLGVSGVGANTARMILSAIPAADLGAVISTGNVAKLKGVKGVGAKTAQRIIVDLRDKINTGADTLIEQVPALSAEAREEALAALTMLGFSQRDSQKALDKIFADNPATTVEAAVKLALAMM